jgi:O-antigen/teichoic acid export membrane protein
MLVGTKKIFIARFPSLVLQPIISIAIAFVIIQITGSLSSITTLLAFAISGLCVFGSQMVALQRVMPPNIGLFPPAYSTNTWLRISIPLLLITGFQLVLQKADIVTIGILKGDEAVGIYNAAVQTATMVSFVFAAVNTVAGPMIASLHTKGDSQGLQNFISVAANWMFWPSLVIAVICILWGKYILSLFGIEFVNARIPLCILAIGHLSNTIFGPVNYLMSLTGHQDFSAKVFGISALLNIVLNITLIPICGLNGAALATMLTLMFKNFWLYIEIKNRLGINSLIFSLTK